MVGWWNDGGSGDSGDQWGSKFGVKLGRTIGVSVVQPSMKRSVCSAIDRFYLGGPWSGSPIRLREVEGRKNRNCYNQVRKKWSLQNKCLPPRNNSTAPSIFLILLCHHNERSVTSLCVDVLRDAFSTLISRNETCLSKYVFNLKHILFHKWELWCPIKK